MRDRLEKLQRELFEARMKGGQLTEKQWEELIRVVYDLLSKYALLERDYVSQCLTRSTLEIPVNFKGDSLFQETHFKPNERLLKVELYAASSTVVNLDYLNERERQEADKHLIHQLLDGMERKKIGQK